LFNGAESPAYPFAKTEKLRDFEIRVKCAEKTGNAGILLNDILIFYVDTDFHRLVELALKIPSQRRQIVLQNTGQYSIQASGIGLQLIQFGLGYR
jgi:hypothetical protein